MCPSGPSRQQIRDGHLCEVPPPIVKRQPIWESLAMLPLSITPIGSESSGRFRKKGLELGAGHVGHGSSPGL
jgi:hypothetical protein